jgi:hypothetical protein
MSTNNSARPCSPMSNSYVVHTDRYCIRILYDSKVASMGQSDSLDLFLDVHRHQVQAGQPELGEQHHLDPQETVIQDTFLIKRCINVSK